MIITDYENVDLRKFLIDDVLAITTIQ